MHTKPETLTAILLEESHRWETTAILRCEVRAEKKEPHRDLMVTGAVIAHKIRQVACERKMKGEKRNESSTMS